MWPWEHVAVAYLALSVSVRSLVGRPPSESAAVAVGVGALVPDLVDKPLSWAFRVFPTGYAAGHSAFVAVPVGLVVVALARRRGRTETGVAFVVGYWSHLLADVVAPLRRGESIAVPRVLWPVVDNEPYARDLGLSRGLVYLVDFASGLLTGPLTTQKLAYVVLPLPAILLWVLDGTPGVRFPVRMARRAVERLGN